MKPAYLIVGALVLVLAGILLFAGQKEVVAPAPVTNETSTAPTTENPTASDMGMTPEEHAAMMTSTATPGTDVGMEMPIMDTDVPPTAQAPGTAKMFMVNGTNFAFDVKEIKVKKGDTVTIHFMSADGFHDLVIDEFNARTEKLQTGGMAMVTFVADKAGTFEYYCSVGKHRMNGMVGKLVVE